MKFILYRDRKKEWRWRLKARNGRVIATSGEGYKRRGSARDAAVLVGAYASEAAITEKRA